MIADDLLNLGLPQFQAVQVPDYYGGSDATTSVVNVIAFTDGEELAPRYGSSAFVKPSTPRQRSS